jgi:NADH-quinone oxidoreductase subunit J
MDWVSNHGLELLALTLLGVGVWWLMPRAQQWPRSVGYLLALAGTVLGLWRLHMPSESAVETVLFSLFAAAAVFCAILMVTSRNPVYSALWFAMVTLNVCGLFLLQFAPFLAAATVIVYAGAIVVTFVFVIMLAQQGGATVYDQRSRQPVMGTIAAFAVLAIILGALVQSAENQVSDDVRSATADEEVLSVATGEPRVTDVPPNERRPLEVAANPLSRSASQKSQWKMRALGRSLFGDYLFAVELAGTLLLVATIGAIAIAPRRARGTL